MRAKNNDLKETKISREFMARLDRLEPEQKVQAIVMLSAKDKSASATTRQSREERRNAIESIREAAKESLPEIDHILERFQGERLTEEVSALGSIRVETTAAGISALASSRHVRAILEDQAISALHQV